MFDPTDFLKVAEELSFATIDEAKLRTSICRSYFYAFLFSREWLKTNKGIIFSNKVDDHKLAHNGLKKYVNRTTRDLLSNLRRNYRNEADYNLTITIQQKQAKDAIVLAKQIVNNIIILPSSTTQGSSSSNP